MARLAFCSPLPPEPTGIADYAAEVLALLAPRHEIDVFHGQAAVSPGAVPSGCGVYPATELQGRHRTQPYELAIHQLGNGRSHAFVYPLLTQVPGLLVLHDLVLHHSRAAMLLDSAAARAYAADPSSAALREGTRGGEAAYAAEVAYAYPTHAERLVAAHLDTIGDLLPYAYPLFQLPVAVSRLTASPTRTLARPVVLMLSFGYMHAHFQWHPNDAAPAPAAEVTDFGKPEAFVPQKVIAKKRAKLLAAAVAACGAATLAGLVAWLLLR